MIAVKIATCRNLYYVKIFKNTNFKDTNFTNLSGLCVVIKEHISLIITSEFTLKNQQLSQNSYHYHSVIKLI